MDKEEFVAWEGRCKLDFLCIIVFFNRVLLRSLFANVTVFAKEVFVPWILFLPLFYYSFSIGLITVGNQLITIAWYMWLWRSFFVGKYCLLVEGGISLPGNSSLLTCSLTCLLISSRLVAPLLIKQSKNRERHHSSLPCMPKGAGDRDGDFLVS